LFIIATNKLKLVNSSTSKALVSFLKSSESMFAKPNSQLLEVGSKTVKGGFFLSMYNIAEGTDVCETADMATFGVQHRSKT
jgi:hypothetical protein